MERGELMYLKQLLKSFEEKLAKIKIVYKNKDKREFENLKRNLIDIQQKISEHIK